MEDLITKRKAGVSEMTVNETESLAMFSPLTAEMAIGRLQKAEHQFAVGQWMTGEDFFSRTRKLIDSYDA